MVNEHVRGWRENGQERNQQMTWKEWAIFVILVLLNVYIGYKLIMSAHNTERHHLRSGGATIPRFEIPDGSPWMDRDRDSL